MEPSSLRTLATLFCAFLFFQSFANPTNPTFNTDEIKARFEAMECIVKPRYTSVVESYLKGYLSGSQTKASRIMGRAVVYFPIFEKYLKEHNLPLDLKCLAVLESALMPKATSPVGAGGLWQFMKETGKLHGLVIDANVDERSCSHRSTEAAMQYLTRQYENYQSWELALASYNCGSGTIKYAIKRARTKDYWALSKYLPRETQNFVPAFLAATYVANYYHLHEVKPVYPNLDMQLTEEVLVFSKLDFSTIAAVTGLPLETVAELNPAFKKNFVPEYINGHFVVLPRRVMQAFKEYLQVLQPDNGAAVEMPALPPLVDLASYKPDELYYQSNYTVAEGDGLEDMAEIFNCTAYNLKAWNNLGSTELERGKELAVWFPKEILRFRGSGKKVDVPSPTQLTEKAPEKEVAKPKTQFEEKAKPQQPASEKKPAPVLKKENKDSGFLFYQLNRNESLLDVAGKFPGVTVKLLMEWNGFSKDKLPQPGANLKIKTS